MGIHGRRSIFLACVHCLCSVTLATAGPPSYRVAALLGQDAPGTPETILFASFLIPPSIDSAGGVAFKAGLSGPGAVGDAAFGIYSEGSGVLTLVARGMEPAPGTEAGVVYTFLGNKPFPLNDAGQMAFNARLSVPGADFTTDSGFWSQSGDVTDLLAREGSPAPGTPEGVNFNDLGLSDVVFNNANQVAFREKMIGPGVNSSNERAYWVGGLGALELAIRQGDPAPDLGPDVIISSINNETISLNDLGVLTSRLLIAGPGVDTSNFTGIWMGSAGKMQLVVRKGDPAPGFEEGVVFSNLGSPADINNNGEIAFRSFIAGPGIDSSNNNVVWAGPPESLQVVARTGTHPAGTPKGTVFTGFAGEPIMSGTGAVTFRASVSDPSDPGANAGIWSNTFGSVQLVARKKDPVPGAPEGTTYFNLSVDPVMNSVGQIAFFASVTNPKLGTFPGIWLADPDGSVTPVVMRGTEIEVAPGDVREVFFIDCVNGSGGEDGRPNPLNDAGQVTFQVTFINSFGIVVFGADPPPPGDMDGDGDVDAADLAQLLGSWGPTEPCPPFDPADLNQDCDVEAFDLAILLGNWGP